MLKINLTWTVGILMAAALASPPLQAADAFGYTATSSVPFSFLDVSGTGTSVLATTDDGAVNLTLPFGFRFYGTSYTSLCVSSNGLITFGGCPADDMTTRDLTAQPTPGNLPVIAPFWMDLTFAVPGAGAVSYQSLGNVGTRKFVLQWKNARALNGPDGLNFEAVLNEGTNTILFQYSKVDSGDAGVDRGAGATVGIAGANAASNGYRLMWSRNTPVITDNEAILFTPPAAAAPVDVSSSVTVTTTAFVFNRLTQTYGGTITVTNSSSNPLARPLTAILTNLTPGVTALNPTGTLAGQGPYYVLPGGGSLAPGAGRQYIGLFQQSHERQDRVRGQNLFGEFLTMASKGLRRVLFILFGVSACWADQIVDIKVDTSSQSGNLGAIYFQFAGGLNPDLASVTISSFSISPPGTLVASPAPFSDGGVTGTLDGLPLTIDNSGGLNDYEHFLVYGADLVFQLVFHLPVTLTGDSGSTFSFGLTSADGLSPVLTQDASGFNGQITYDLSGVFTADRLGNDTIESIVLQPSAVPEPASVLLLASALTACWRLRRRSQIPSD